MPIFVKTTIDSLFEVSTPKNFNDILMMMLKIGGIYMLLAFFKGLFLFLLRQSIIIMSRLIEFDLKNEIYNYFYY